MTYETTLDVQASARITSFLSALMPTTEGLFLVTVVNGPTGHLRFTFDQRCRADLDSLISDIQQTHPHQLRVLK